MDQNKHLILTFSISATFVIGSAIQFSDILPANTLFFLQNTVATHAVDRPAVANTTLERKQEKL